MTDNALTYRIAFASLRSLMPEFAHELLSHLGSEENFFATSASKLTTMCSRRLPIFDDKYRADLLKKAEAESKWVKSNNIRTIYFTDDDYPQRLRECVDHPLMLYGIGDCDIDANPALSIVGTRHSTAYGINLVNNLVHELAERMSVKPIIISGLAYGIDIAAHRAALDTGLPTIAIVAHGLNTIYPAAHRDFASRIVKAGNGMILTEYPSWTAMHRHNFLARNRIIAGLSDCVIVAESARKGGAMATARAAREYDRDVFAFPGRVGDLYSEGCNDLISNNIASLLTGADSLAKAMNWSMTSPNEQLQMAELALDDDQLEILSFLTDHPDTQLNRMSTELNRPVSKLMAALIDLEFKGLVLAIPGGRYRTA